MTLDSPLALLLLVGIGVVAGTLNVLAGGGSFLTLPVLIFLGLPATTANGTNRVGILLQNVAASWSFARGRVLEPKQAVWLAAPATLGAGIGSWMALIVGDRAFEQVLAWLMVGVTALTMLWDPSRRERKKPLSRTALMLGFFLVGIYGGFVQAGVGFLILAVVSLAGLDLVRGNALKVLVILCFSVLALLLFAFAGHVAWRPGLALAVGTVLGGLLGARLTVLKGHRFVKRLVFVCVVVFAIRLLVT